MNLRRTLAALAFTTLFLGLTSPGHQVKAQTSQAAPAASFTQSETAKQDDEINLDTQLFILIATNQDVGDPKLPVALESVVKQLRASLPFKNYRLAVTLINRVKNEGRLSLKWIGDPLFNSASTATGGTLTPSFNDFSVKQ
jgi:hypothetical protein